MKPVKEICPHCNKAILYSSKEKILKHSKQFISTLLIMLGLFFILFVSFNGLENTAYQISGLHYTRQALNYHDEVRELAVNITNNCNGDDPYCLVKALFDDMSNIRYVPDSLYYSDRTYHPIYVYNNGDDCEGLSQMFVAFSRSIGINSWVECGNKHCVALFRAYPEHDIMVIDLTIPLVYRLHETERFTDLDLDMQFERRIWR